MENNKIITILGAGFTTENMGVWALASGAMVAIKSAYPNSKIFIMDYSKNTESYEVEYKKNISIVKLLNIRFCKNVFMQNNIAWLIMIAIVGRLLPSSRLQKKLYSKNYLLSHIQKTSFFGSIAGGDSFSDIYGLERLIYVSLPQLLVLIMKKHLMLLPQTIGPFNSMIGKLLARFILKRSDKVLSRDFEGINSFRKYSRNILFCYDMGFLLEPMIKKDKLPSFIPNLSNKKPIVGINISGLLYAGGYNKNNMFGLTVNYSETVIRIIEYFSDKVDAYIILIPHVLGDQNNIESDYFANKSIIKRSRISNRKNIYSIEESMNHQEIKAIIGLCNFFIGSRMHACIAALSQCIPAIGLAYSRKFKGVYETIGIEDLVIDLYSSKDDAIMDRIESIYSMRNEFKNALLKKIPRVKNKIYNLFNEIR